MRLLATTPQTVIAQHRIILSHPTGNTFVRATARALHARGWLDSFYTTIAADGDGAERLLPRSVRRQVARRDFSDIPRALVHTRPWRETLRLGAARLGFRDLVTTDAVYRDLDSYVAEQIRRSHETVTGVYAYEDGAEHLFRAASQRGFACVYELPIAHWQATQRLLHEEADRLPAWRQTLTGLSDSHEKLERKSRELELAHTVIVPSEFVLNTLPAEIRRSKNCVVAPFGAPQPQQNAPRRATSGRLRVLFAGALTQRKGLADVFAAMKRIRRSDVELVVMGSPISPLSFYREQYADFTYEAPRPHGEVLALMQTCDVLVLPAIVEGRALVQLEALACGLPLIVTHNAGATDLIEEGRNGFVVPIRSPEGLAERMSWFADRRHLLPDMRVEALRTATASSWSYYETQVCASLGAPAAAH